VKALGYLEMPLISQPNFWHNELLNPLVGVYRGKSAVVWMKISARTGSVCLFLIAYVNIHWLIERGNGASPRNLTEGLLKYGANTGAGLRRWRSVVEKVNGRK